MKKILILILGVVVLGGGVLLFLKSRLGSEGQGQAVLRVNSNTTATVFLDGRDIGKTPYEDKVAPGEYTVKLIPESTVTSLVSWEEKVRLTPNLLTYVSRDLGESEVTSAGEVLTLEKIAGTDAQIAVITTPDGATITLSGSDKGTTPQVLEGIEPGNYDLTVATSGYTSRTVKVKTTGGYKLTAAFQLALVSEPSVSPTPTPTPIGEGPSSTPKATPKGAVKASPKATPKATSVPGASASPKTKASPPAKPYVEILDTPTGFLRVRKEPSTSAEELARLSPGEFFPLLDEESGWYKIEYESDKDGWISGQYAEKFE